jgi:hypothetical protein
MGKYPMMPRINVLAKNKIFALSSQHKQIKNNIDAMASGLIKW